MLSPKKTIFLGTFIGRFFGYIREIIIIVLFGLSPLANEVVFLLTSFDALASVFAYGTITMISLQYISRSEIYFKKLKYFFYCIGFIYASFCSLLIYYNNSILNFSVLIPFVALLNIDYSMNLAIQQDKNDFTWTAFTSVIINSILIICIFIYPNKILFFLILLTGLLLRNLLIKKYNQKFYLVNVVRDLTLYEKKTIALTVFASGLFYIIPIFDRFVAERYDGIAMFNFGDRILIFSAVILNGVFIYPRIVDKQQQHNSSYLYKKIFRTNYFVFLLVTLSISPLSLVLVLRPTGSMSDFFNFATIHFLHLVPFILFLSTIQIWTVQSKYTKIIKLTLFLLLSRLPLIFFSSSILQYTISMLIIDIFVAIYIFRYEK